MAPANMQHSLTVAKQGGDRQMSVRLPGSSWTPAAPWNPAMPGVWASDWWVPLGTLTSGDYSGTVRDVGPRDFLTWLGEDADVVAEPVVFPAYDETIPISFRVR
jgi:hypothetical protein